MDVPRILASLETNGGSMKRVPFKSVRVHGQFKIKKDGGIWVKSGNKFPEPPYYRRAFRSYNKKGCLGLYGESKCFAEDKMVWVK
jgi:hypothetical protein